MNAAAVTMLSAESRQASNRPAWMDLERLNWVYSYQMRLNPTIFWRT